MKIITIIISLIFISSLIGGLTLSYGEWSGYSDKRYRCIGSSNQDNELISSAAVQIYTARSARWRGAVSSHTWIALKKKTNPYFKRYEILGWGKTKTTHYLHIKESGEDNYWYGYKPLKIFEVLGKEAEQLIPLIEDDIKTYPFLDHYKAWPGPNSNTFIAYLAKKHPTIDVDLPSNSIGKDYSPGFYFGPSPSNTGKQFSYKGLIGIILARNEGIEFNILGATFGLDFSPFDLKLPAIGRLSQLKKQLFYINQDCN